MINHLTQQMQNTRLASSLVEEDDERMEDHPIPHQCPTVTKESLLQSADEVSM